MTRLVTVEDLDAIAALTAAHRRRLASWSPRWWRIAERADDLHRGWLLHLIEAEGTTVRVTTEHGHVVACAAAVPQGPGWVVDDVAVTDDERWSDLGVELLDAFDERPALTCVPTQHLARRAASEAAHLHHVSSYWIRPTSPAGAPDLPRPSGAGTLPPAPPHTFGGPLDASATGALTIAGDDGGVLVGSPSIVAPPVYDPGGTVCIVDRVTGDPAPLLELALRGCGARGDVLLAVVAGIDDDRLRAGLRDLDFERTVDVFAWPSGRDRPRWRAGHGASSSDQQWGGPH